MTDIHQIYFIDDEADVRMASQQTLELADYSVRCFDRAAAALEALSSSQKDFPGIIITDVRMPDMDGLRLLAALQGRDRELPVLLITGHGDIAMAVDAMRAGAYDFIEKPFGTEHLLDAVGRAMEKRRLVLENRTLRRALDSGDRRGPPLIGNTQGMRDLRRMIASIGPSDADILIMGETGTGKEVVARALHDHSRRRDGNFVAVNCGALPESVIESELFGHESGAFTGANQRRIGKIEHASGGTLFLDEIESMPLALQVKLLRVLQERSLERLGSNTSIPLNLRVLAASKVDLRKAADAGTFREDLYYRLNVMVVGIPPLRDRIEDVPALFQHFVLDAAGRLERDPPSLAPSQTARLAAHRWPGNVRELRNVAERFVLLDGIDAALPTALQAEGGIVPLGSSAEGSLSDQVNAFEKTLISQALRLSEGCVRQASENLRIPRKTLHDKLRKHHLDRTDFTPED
jgi:two-component system C4-dicarboxylate transport response regulator DctD